MYSEFFFFFKQKTAYEIYQCDWSSDVCSSDLVTTDGHVVGISALLLNTDLPPEQKEPLLVNFVQVGIDLGSMIRAGHPGWTGYGKKGSLFAGQSGGPCGRQLTY